MIFSAKNNFSGSAEYDICIIGSGPSGLTIAAELANSGLKIAVLESGSKDSSIFSSNMKKVEYNHLSIKDNSRERGLGGSTRTWRGLSAPLDPIDLSKWPIKKDEMDRYLEIASERYGFPALSDYYSSDFLPTKSIWKNFAPKVFQTKRPVLRFGEEFSYLFRYGTLDLITDCTAVKIISEKNSANYRVAKEVMAKTEEGMVVKIKSKKYILAAGAIENARLLLLSDLGNEFDQVGRYFMNHPKGFAGTIKLHNSEELIKYFFQDRKGILSYVGLRLKEEIQDSRNLLNSYVQLVPSLPWTDSKEVGSFGEGVGLVKSLLRDLGNFKISFFHHLLLLIKIIPTLIYYFPKFLYLAILRLRAGRNPVIREIKLRFYLEMEPQTENRVYLGERKDALDVPIPVIDFQLSQKDKLTFNSMQSLLSEEIENLGIGQLIISKKEKNEFPQEDASHHLGGTRMGEKIETSVVDHNLKVHQTENVFVAGGSVFPTGGNINPTYTIVALSIRLAQYLKSIFPTPARIPEAKQKKLLLIGAGRRVKNDIVPVIESLPMLKLQSIFARSPKYIFGSRQPYVVESLSKLDKAHIADSDIIYLSIPPKEVSGVINALAEFDCTHICLILPTPVPNNLNLDASRFKEIAVEEDMVFLPWIQLVKKFFNVQNKNGKIKEIIIDKAAYRYHAIALIKVISNIFGSDKPNFIWRFMNIITVVFPHMKAVLIGPRDYDRGSLIFRGDIKNVDNINLLGEGRCTGFGLEELRENLNSEESALFGPLNQKDTIINRMHDIKRIGLRRLIDSLIRNDRIYGIKEAQNDYYIDKLTHKFPIYFKRIK